MLEVDVTGNECVKDSFTFDGNWLLLAPRLLACIRATNESLVGLHV